LLFLCLDHMAKVKDKLIFETKKMDAVADRKSNREQKLRSKESHANKLDEKHKRKKDHFKQVEDWATSAASNRGGALQDNADDAYLQRMGRQGQGPNRKRENADKKFGHGGKNGRFKQGLDSKTRNDTSGFNPRGNFGGAGTKRSAKTSGGGGAGAGAGANRQGKRARDASRSRA
jgi:rRNA-processing protein EBP2